MKKISLILTTFIFTFIFVTAALAADFSDVPKDRWSYSSVNRLRALNITQGIGDNKFGPELTITKAEFTVFLCNLLGLETEKASAPSFKDYGLEKWYADYIETALKHGIITASAAEFKPETPITREEMAIMIVRALGYDELAKSLNLDAPFADVYTNKNYITIAKDLGIVSGISADKFAPAATATREQAAAMMVRMYDVRGNKISEINGFYAIKSSSQQDMLPGLSYASFGWSRLELGDGELFLNISGQNSNEYRIPDGYEIPFGKAKNKMLMVAVKDADSNNILADAALRTKAVSLISDAVLNGISKDSSTLKFDGVVIDFETLKGEAARNNLNAFLKDLRQSLGSKLIFTAVHPKRAGGLAHYDGYDYKTIGELSDKVILMAHDYNAKRLESWEMELNMHTTPLSPVNEIYFALKAITDPETGVSDKSKIMLQISFDTCQWKIQDEKIINSTPYSPDYETLYSRIQLGGVEMNYSKTYENPYIRFYNEQDNTQNIVWYEDARSVAAKKNLAKHFGIQGISLWRLGNVPDFSADYYLNVKGSLAE